jgi:hypothetical protein
MCVSAMIMSACEFTCSIIDSVAIIGSSKNNSGMRARTLTYPSNAKSYRLKVTVTKHNQVDSMDKWEQMMQAMMQMPEEEQMKKKQMLASMCICRGCPSYEGTGETEVMFCSSGKSSVITVEKGCICGECPVTPEMGLTNIYFCTRGNEAEQRKVLM